ncbi:MAG: efflux RND transporter periplasmic adaptor subunit, partial [Gemmatimonadota bacterium]
MAENQEPYSEGGRPPAGGEAGAPGGPAEGRAKGKRRGKLGVIIPLLILLVVAVVGGGYWYLKIRGVISTDDAYVDGDRIAVSTKIPGRIAMLGTDEGDTVQAGQLLVQLDDSDLRARRSEAQAGLTLAQENVKLAAARLSQASDDYNRSEVQFKGHAVSQEALDHARTALTMARVQHSIALAQVEKARAALNTVQTQIQDTRVEAPLHGVVAKRWVLPGDVVQPGQPIFTIYDLQDVWF